MLLHGFGASAFARNACGLARLMGEFSDGFLTVVATTAMLYGLRSTWLMVFELQSPRSALGYKPPVPGAYTPSRTQFHSPRL